LSCYLQNVLIHSNQTLSLLILFNGQTMNSYIYINPVKKDE